MIKLLSSNENKLKEFQRFGLKDIEIVKNIDLPEIDSDVNTVSIYKSLSAGKNTLIEDTSLYVFDQNNVPIFNPTDIRWNVDHLDQYKGLKSRWTTILAYNNGKEIFLFRGDVNGCISSNPVKNDFGFDGFFVPQGSQKTLAELEDLGMKDNFSARKIAAINFLNNDFNQKVDIVNIKPWRGRMQNKI